MCKEYENIVEIFVPLVIDGEPTNYIIGDGGTIVNNVTGKTIKPVRRKDNGYSKVCLRINKQNRHFSVHRLVAISFIPNPENKPTVNHILPGNEGKLKNAVWNLEWATNGEQTEHALKTGIKKSIKGINNPHNKIDVETVHKICKLLEKGKSVLYISDKLNVPRTIVDNILYKVSWENISSEYDIRKESVCNNKFHRRMLCRDDIFKILDMQMSGKKPSEVYKELEGRVKKYTIQQIYYRDEYYRKEKDEYRQLHIT